MTLQEAKDQIAYRDYHKPFHEIFLESTRLVIFEEAAELYARSKWDECYQHLHDNAYDCVFPSKPKFKP